MHFRRSGKQKRETKSLASEDPVGGEKARKYVNPVNNRNPSPENACAQRAWCFPRVVQGESGKAGVRCGFSLEKGIDATDAFAAPAAARRRPANLH